MDVIKILNKIWKNLIWIPEARFDELTKDKGYKESFYYLLVCFAIAFPIVCTGTIFFMGEQYATMNIFEKISTAIISTLLYVVLAVPATYIGIMICHLLLKLLGGDADLIKTAQIFIYGQTPSTVLGSIPYLGWIFSLISLVCVVLGSKRIHKISLLRAVIAIVIIPLIVTMTIGAIIAAYFISSNTFTGPVY